MAENQNKYVSPSRLSLFLDNLRTIFSPLTHTHKISDISDYTVDSELSSTSNNPVANSVLNAEFDAISDAMGALELSIDEHTHTVSDISDLTATVDELNFVSGATENIQSQLNVITSRIFVGTYAEYQAANANNEIPINAIVILTDDESSSGGSGGGSTSTSTSSLLGTGALGYMILG